MSPNLLCWLKRLGVKHVHICTMYVNSQHTRQAMANLRKSEDNLGGQSSPSTLRQSLLFCHCIHQARWPSSFWSFLVSIYPSPNTSARIAVDVHAVRLWHGSWGFELRSSHLCGKCFYSLSHLHNLKEVFFNE